VVDAALALLVVVVVGVAVAADLDGDDVQPGASAYLFVIGFGVLVLLRRRWPVLVLLASAALVVAYHAMDNPAIGIAVPVAVALYSAAEQGHPRWAAGTAIALLVVSTVARVNEGDDVALLLGYELASQAGLMVAVVALGDAVRSRRGWRAELRRQAEAAAAEREREAARRVEEERLRIARELHDVLAHTLSVVTLHADVAREALEDETPDVAAARDALVAVREAAGGATRDLRATVGLLRAEPAPGLDQLDELVRAAGDSGLRVEVVADGSMWDLPAVVATTAYRIVQESLTNVLRHADARTATVDLHREPDALIVRVRDDGRGGVPRNAGYGLAGMRERAGLLGGRVAAGRGEKGWVVEAVLPLRGLL
jgi:signal transduction histidine kinase